MTTTSVFQGNFMGKPSSRVLRPPGGGSSNIFGGSDEPAKPTQPTADPEAPCSAGEPAASAAPVEPTTEEQKDVAPDGLGEKAATTSEPPKSSDPPKKKKIGYNPITGEEYEIQETSAARTSVSMRQPPGGASSGLW